MPVDGDEEEEETAAEKRLRLAKDLIARAEAAGLRALHCVIFEERDVQEDEEITMEAVAHRLKTDLVGGAVSVLLTPQLEQKGSLRRVLAERVRPWERK